MTPSPYGSCVRNRIYFGPEGKHARFTPQEKQETVAAYIPKVGEMMVGGKTLEWRVHALVPDTSMISWEAVCKGESRRKGK